MSSYAGLIHMRSPISDLGLHIRAMQTPYSSKQLRTAARSNRESGSVEGTRKQHTARLHVQASRSPPQQWRFPPSSLPSVP
jgi:hypothetical protein